MVSALVALLAAAIVSTPVLADDDPGGIAQSLLSTPGGQATVITTRAGLAPEHQDASDLQILTDGVLICRALDQGMTKNAGRDDCGRRRDVPSGSRDDGGGRVRRDLPKPQRRPLVINR